jgi:asparagine synthase (glutamine-hydrolysing)
VCGIGGILVLDGGAPPERESLSWMGGALRHRGPDAAGIFSEPRAGLVHTRLSIIDPIGGRQPFTNGRRWLVHNGEIFNHLELRAELESLGHRFRTNSDTEVALEAFEEWGVRSFERMNGQFALALWDAERGSLLLARDRFGVRPLHWLVHAGRLYFASEVKGIFAADPSIPRKLDPVGLGHTFHLWCTVPPTTIFFGISELGPGALLEVKAGATARPVERRIQRALPFPERREDEFAGSVVEAAERVREELTGSTRLCILRADVPVGCCLSGGLDSSLVATLGRRAKQGPLHTFSLRFRSPKHDETHFQRRMAEHLGSLHHELEIDRGDIAAVFPDVIRATERPVLRSAPAAMFLLSRLVRSAGIKVVLTSEGADELFAGCDLFKKAAIRRSWARSVLHRLLSPGLCSELKGVDPEGAVLARLPEAFARWTPLAQDTGDRVMMAHGIEGRFPFLDPKVASLAARLPSRYKLDGLSEKHVLKTAGRDLLPPEIVARRKHPHRAPDSFVENGGPEWVKERLDARALTDAQVFDPVQVGLLFEKCKRSASDGELSNSDHMALLGVISTQLVHQLFIRAAPERTALEGAEFLGPDRGR